MRSSPLSQRGAAFLTLVAVLAAVSIMFVLAQASWQSKQRNNETLALRTTRVAQAAEALRHWYELNAPAIDATGFSAPSSDALLSAAGIPRQWRLTSAVSAPLVRGQIHYRVIGVWAEGDDSQEPTFDTATGTLTLCPDSGITCDPARASARIEGYAIQSELYAATIRSLRALANASQAYFHGLWMADPDHNLSNNYFRGECSAPPSQLPCLDGWTQLTATTLLERLGEPATRAVDAWGGAVSVLNGETLDDSPPFKQAFRATTPWGQDITIYALQRL